MTRICSVHGCGKKHGSKGFCHPHYMRMRRYGDPMGGESSRGKAQDFLHDVVFSYNGEGCLTWPYTVDGDGYAKVRWNGKMARVSRIICARVYGPAPTPKHEAAHSCGKGHLACVAMGHHSWKTPSENAADKLLHGTDARGEKCSTAKLTTEQVLLIRSLRPVATCRELADRFGVQPATIKAIEKRITWAWLPDSKAVNSSNARAA